MNDMKNIISIFILIIIFATAACKKETTNSKYNYTDDEVTQGEIISNFMTQVEGDIRLENDNYIGANKDQTTSNNGSFSAIVRVKNDFSDNYLQTGYILLNNKKILPTVDELKYYDYQYTDANLFANPSTNIQIFDTKGKKIIGFTTKNAKPILLNLSKNIYKLGVDTMPIIAKWNKDPENKLGVIFVLLGSRLTRYVFGDENIGELNLSEIIPNGIDKYSIYAIRGSILIKEGADGRKYKLYSVSKSYQPLTIY